MTSSTLLQDPQSAVIDISSKTSSLKSAKLDEQRFRITQIDSKKGDLFKVKYQIADGIDWMPERNIEIGSYLVQSRTGYDGLTSAIARVFNAEDRWGTAELRITMLKFTYAEIDDKGDKKHGIESRQPGELTHVAISSDYISQWVFSNKDEPRIGVGTFKQVVSSRQSGEAGYLSQDELEALQDLLDEFGDVLARELNKKVEFKSVQLSLL
jgi:hypothetical protein